MRKNRRAIRWVTACTALLIAAGFIWKIGGDRVPLPPNSSYDNLPKAFTQALRQAREKIDSQGEDPATVRKLARLYHANRLYREARDCYRVIAASPQGLTARDHFYLADIATNGGDLETAQTELRAVRKVEPHYLPARLALAESLFKSGQEHEAEKEYSSLLAIEMDQPQAALGLARIELQRGDEASAVSRLEKLMAGHPESTSAAALLAQVFERRGAADRASAMKQWSLQKPEPIPADPWMAELDADLYDIQRLGLKFEDYFRTGQIAEATPFLQRIEELDPKSPIPPLLRGWSEAQAHRHSEAVLQYQQALAKGGDPEKICPHLVQSLLALENTGAATTLMAEHYARTPESVPLTKTYADVAIRVGNEKLAKSLLEKVLLKEPYLQPQNMSLAKILWTSGERDAAAARLRHVALVDARDVASRALLGEYYLGKGDPLSAITPLEQANAVVGSKTPAQAGVRALLGQAYFQSATRQAEQNRLEDAVTFYEKFIQLAPADLNGYAGKANAYVQLKQFRRAAEALEKMLPLDAANPTIYLSLGDVLYQDGNREQARRNWERARPLVAAGDNELSAALNARLSGHITPDTFK